jgi:adenine-specific DNA-methyltransferase
MPTLQFKGKTFVQNHHLAVPFHQLVPQPDKSHTEKVSLNDNLIIHGDNLTALKALLPTYAGKVKCIYIDPPYNTGNEGWVYNDNVKSPLIKEWIGRVVGKEGEDLVRHDKWLCMMMPRLKLLRELLSDDGAIFISIDDNEQAFLILLMNEIFGESNFRAQITWQKKYSVNNNQLGIAPVTEYIVVYSKSSAFTNGLLPRTEASIARYKNPDNDARGPWKPVDYWAPTSPEERPNLTYTITNPNTGLEINPTKKSWKYSPEVYQEHVSENKIWWGSDGKSTVPALKLFLSDVKDGLIPPTLWLSTEVGHTDESAKELQSLFDNKVVFDTPKPIRLIKRILQIASDKDSIILDSFAGSGTTAQAVLELNKEDGGNRKFILVECEDYADTITAERVRRVIKGVPNAKNELVKKGLGGSFSYFELGDAIEMESLLAGKSLPNYSDLARYLFYTATGEEFKPDALDESSNYVGKTEQFDVYMYYKPDLEYLKTTALTLDTARALREKAGSRPLLVFAPTKYVEQQTLDELNITFCQLPFEIYRLKN